MPEMCPSTRNKGTKKIDKSQFLTPTFLLETWAVTREKSKHNLDEAG